MKISKLLLFVAAGGITAIVGDASAADLPVKAPRVAAYSWTGFYAGVNVGAGWGSRTVGYDPNDPLAISLFLAGGAPPPASFGTSGALGGIQLGYNLQVSTSWLVGVEADIDGSGIKGSGSTSGAYAPYFTAPFNAPFQSEIDWLGTVRGRLGYLPTSNLLVYGTGGFAYGRVVQSGSWNTNTGFAVTDGFQSINCFGNPVCFAGSSSGTSTGWTAGAGFEYALWQKWTIRAEYLYVSLGSGGTVTEAVVGPTPGTSPSSFNANFGRTNFNVVRVGLNYEFH